MAALDNHILTITEPTIKLDELKFNSFGEGEGNEKANTSQAYDLLVSINGFIFGDDDIRSFSLKNNSKIPTLDITIMDTTGLFGIDTYPRDGDVLSFRMAAKAKKVYKDIRIDFDIVRVDSPGTNKNKEQSSGGIKYVFNCRMKVPGMYAENCKSYGTGTSLDHIELLANDLKLGLATNIDSSDDEMNLLLAYENINDTLDELVKHSYVGEESFQTYCIDPYYYVNYVDLNQLLNAEGKFEEALANFDVDLDDQPSSVEEGTESGNELESFLVLNNNDRFEGTNLFIESYKLVNKTGSKLKKNGYKRAVQYYENDSEENGLIKFDVEALSGKNLSDIEEPLKGRRNEERYKEEVKHKYVGRRHSDPENSNTHLNYEYSRIHNLQNLDEVGKLQLVVDLGLYNPAIHRFQKIPVIITNSSEMQIGADRVNKEDKAESGFDTEAPETPDIPSHEEAAYDEFLSGNYIVGGIEYIYKQTTGVITQRLTLLRREWPARINNMPK